MGGAMFQAAGQNMALLVSLTPELSRNWRVDERLSGTQSILYSSRGPDDPGTPTRSNLDTLLVLTPVALRIPSLRDAKCSYSYVSGTAAH
jgi:hypothetical protein